MKKYNIYATLIDAFAWYRASESDTSFQEFIDKINRKPFESEKADKGTAFNELVDYLIHSKEINLLDTDKFILYPFKNKLGKEYKFEFNKKIALEFAEYFQYSLSQVAVNSDLHTSLGVVNLYGYVDEIKYGCAFDIKTTSSYNFPKYLNAWQHKVYLYCLLTSGSPIKEFEYTITDFNHLYKELYTWNQSYILDLINICEELISFIELHKNLITDKKIYND